MTKKISHQIELSIYKIPDLPIKHQELVKKTIDVAPLSSYSPYSKFKVGAGVLLNDGEIILGSNQENMAYPSGLCAERIAIFSAMSQFPEKEITAIAIYSPSIQDKTAFVPPCGACRQVMAELEYKQAIKEIPVLLISQELIVYQADNIQTLLPFPFVL